MRKKKTRIVLFSDLDGTFLDHVSYSSDLSRPVLLSALAKNLAVVFCSSKTAEEIHYLQAELDIHLPFIAENGGGIYIPERYLPSVLDSLPKWRTYRVLALGVQYRVLLEALRSVREELNLRMRGFTDMSVEEIGRLCGLDEAESLRARTREFDEPFILEDESPVALARMKAAFERRGLQITRGGRFFHLTGNCDKGKAVLRLTDMFRKEWDDIRTAGIGDSPNDIPMLQQVDIPILVMKPDKSYDPEVLREVPGVQKAGGIGPAGWANSIRRLCNEISDFTSSEGKQKT